MNIPEFPDARPLVLEDKPLFDRLFAAMQPEISQYTFTNLFAWRQVRKTQVSRIGEVILVLLDQRDRSPQSESPGNGEGKRFHSSGFPSTDYTDSTDSRPGFRCSLHQRSSASISGSIPESRRRLTFLEPIGEGAIREAMEECLRKGATPAEVEFKYFSWDKAALFQGDPKFTLEQDRDNSDYLYLAQDLCELAGRKYDAKRNFIRRFQSERNYRYLPLTPDLARECRKFEEHWCEDRSCQSDEGLSHEMDAVLEMLDNFEALSYRGGALDVNGRVVAFSLGEPLSDETFVVHVEKADAKLTGIYAVINQEFCRREAVGYKYVNREQDLGIPGLRQAKQSYHPVRIVDTYRLTRATGADER